MQNTSRTLIGIRNLTFVVITASILGCSTIAQWAAPAKPVVEPNTPELVALEKKFFASLHSAGYQDIPELLESYTGLYFNNPGHPVVAARLGFLHVWRLSERHRLKKITPDVIDNAALCKKYFAAAHNLKPKNAVYHGFYAACVMAEADIDQNEAEVRRGYYEMKTAISAWPEFNYFTGGYVLSSRPWDSDVFNEGVDYQWQNLDACIDGTIDRNNPDYSQYMKLVTKEGKKRACWNSEIAPHNFEGFFLNFGDMLVKQGRIDVAKKIYAQARLSPEYDTWPYRKHLEHRIENAEANKNHFRQSVPKNERPQTPQIMFNSDLACMACHLKT